jgi:predicted HAD superfamily Cof-like phosphohydrolase
MSGMAIDPDRPLASSPAGLVREFHEYVGSTVRSTPSVTVEGARRRCDFVYEEARELREAIESGDVVAAADALADLAYVVYGSALHFGIDLDAVLAEVHRSNMTKSPAGDGKAIKGSSYEPPDLAHVLGA